MKSQHILELEKDYSGLKQTIQMRSKDWQRVWDRLSKNWPEVFPPGTVLQVDLSPVGQVQFSVEHA